MKLNELLQESDDESLRKFRKSVLDRVEANVQSKELLSRQHDWKFNVGDNLLSTKTGKVYKLIARTFQKSVYDQNMQRYPEPRMIPVYYYETNDGGRGTFREDALLQSKTMKSLTTPAKF